MASVEKQVTAKNEYQNRNAFIGDYSKGYGVEKHTRVVSLAENGRYISGRKLEDNTAQIGKSSALTHVKRQSAEKFISGKTHKAHYGDSEPNAAASELNTGNTNRYVQSGSNAGTTAYGITKSGNQSTVAQSEKAAELKEQLKRDVAISRLNDKKEALKDNTTKYIDKQDKTDNKFGERDNSTENSQKYFSYKRAKTESVYKKKIYRVNKRMDRLNSGKSSINNFTTLRKLAILKQDIVRPIKNGDVIGVATVPATIYLKKLLEKTALGRAAVRGKEAGSKAIAAANNSADTSQAMYAATSRLAEETVKGAAGTVNRAIRKKHEKNKYLRAVKNAERAENRANKYLAKSLNKIANEEAAAASGTASAKLMKKVENFSKKDVAKKKQQKIEAKNKRLENKIRIQYKRKNHIFKNKFKKKGKLKILSMAAGALSAIAPVILIIISAAIIGNFVMYPFFYLTQKKDKTDDFGNIYTENEIEESPVKDTIQHYYKVMDKVVDDFNAEIIAFQGGGDEYDNTGVANPEKKAQYDTDYQVYQEQNDAYMYWDYGDYVDTYNTYDPPTEPEKNYWYTEEELSAGGMERGPIFEGYRWSPETDGTTVPKGNLYDEMLCTISTYNAKCMTRPDSFTSAEDTETDEDGNPVSEAPASSGGDIILMTDDTVAGAYGGAGFWEFTNWEEGVDCPSGGECCWKMVLKEVTETDDEGNTHTHYEQVEEKYCPSHFVIMMKLDLDFNLDKVWESYNFDDEDEKVYKDTKKQFEKDKK